MVRSNMVKSKFHLIKIFDQIFATFLECHVLKCVINSKMVNSKFHYIEVILTLA